MTKGPFGLRGEARGAAKPPLDRCEGFPDHPLACMEQESMFGAEPEGPFIRTTPSAFEWGLL